MNEHGILSLLQELFRLMKFYKTIPIEFTPLCFLRQTFVLPSFCNFQAG